MTLRTSNIFLLAAAFISPSTIHCLSITNNLISSNNWVARHAATNIHGFRYCKRMTRDSLTTAYGKSGTISEFKDIDIDDVLLEAENALNIAQVSLVEENGDKKKENKDKNEFKDIDINDVLLEAQSALNVAQVSLVDENRDGKSDFFFNDPVQDSITDNVIDELTIEASEIQFSTIGGISLGLILGSVATFELTDLPSLSFDLGTSSLSSVQIPLPIITGMILGGTAGFGGSLQDNMIGTITRNILGVPVRALVSAIVGSIQEAATRQVEKTTNEIKAIPSNVANSAKQKAAETAKEAKVATDVAIQSAIENLKQLIVVLGLLTCIAAAGLFITNALVVTDI